MREELGIQSSLKRGGSELKIVRYLQAVGKGDARCYDAPSLVILLSVPTR